MIGGHTGRFSQMAAGLMKARGLERRYALITPLWVPLVHRTSIFSPGSRFYSRCDIHHSVFVVVGNVERSVRPAPLTNFVNKGVWTLG